MSKGGTIARRSVTDRQWAAVQPHLPQRQTLRGRPLADNRLCPEGILWVLWTGSPWSELPTRYGSKSTVHWRSCQWTACAVFLDLWRALLQELDDRQRARWDGCLLTARCDCEKRRS